MIDGYIRASPSYGETQEEKKENILQYDFQHEKYPQLTAHIDFLFCFLLHFKDGVSELIILDGCMLYPLNTPQ